MKVSCCRMRTLSFESHCAAKLQISDSESQKNFILRKQPWTLDEARLNIHVSFCSYRQISLKGFKRGDFGCLSLLLYKSEQTFSTSEVNSLISTTPWIKMWQWNKSIFVFSSRQKWLIDWFVSISAVLAGFSYLIVVKK